MENTNSILSNTEYKVINDLDNCTSRTCIDIPDESSCNGILHRIPNTCCNFQCLSKKECQLLPLSGNEPKLNMNNWNTTNTSINNCYSYVLDDINSINKKPQPGYWAGYEELNDEDHNCNTIKNRILEDNPEIKWWNRNIACPPKYYKGFLAIDPGVDYHFYRQDSNGKWSHKPGINNVINFDEDNDEINDPICANRIYYGSSNSGNLFYTEPCGYFCVPENDSKDTYSTSVAQ